MNTRSIIYSPAIVASTLMVLGAFFVGCIDEDPTDQQWIGVDSPAENTTIEDIDFIDERRGWMATGGGAGVDDAGAWYTDDGGQSWELRYHPFDARTIAFDVPGDRVWMGGSDQRQLWVSDDGDSFEPMADGFEQHDNISGVHFWDEDTGLATTETSDRLHRTSNGGDSFEMTEAGRSQVPGTNDLDALGDEIWLASGPEFTTDNSGAVILYSDDRAQSWETIQLEDNAHRHEGGTLQAIHVVDENEIWAGGSNRQLYFTRDGMETWRQVEGIPDEINHFYAIDSYGDHFIAAGSSSTSDDVFVFSSEDAGDSWQLMDFDEEACLHGCILRGLEYVHSQLAYAYGPNNTLLRLGSP